MIVQDSNKRKNCQRCKSNVSQSPIRIDARNVANWLEKAHVARRHAKPAFILILFLREVDIVKAEKKNNSKFEFYELSIRTGQREIIEEKKSAISQICITSFDLCATFCCATKPINNSLAVKLISCSILLGRRLDALSYARSIKPTNSRQIILRQVSFDKIAMVAILLNNVAKMSAKCLICNNAYVALPAVSANIFHLHTPFQMVLWAAEKWILSHAQCAAVSWRGEWKFPLIKYPFSYFLIQRETDTVQHACIRNSFFITQIRKLAREMDDGRRERYRQAN